MKTIEILVAIGIALPVLLLFIKKKVGVNRTPPDYLQKITTANHLDISEYEELPGKFLVMDLLHKKLMFCRYASSKVQSIVIDLSSIMSCRLEKEVATTGGLAHIETIGMVFRHKFHQGEKDIHLTLYNSHRDGLDEAYSYYQMAKDWVKKVEGSLEKPAPFG